MDSGTAVEGIEDILTTFANIHDEELADIVSVSSRLIVLMLTHKDATMELIAMKKDTSPLAKEMAMRLDQIQHTLAREILELLIRRRSEAEKVEVHKCVSVVLKRVYEGV